MKAGLTRRQWELLWFIQDYSHEHGYSPSMEEMKRHVGLHSKSGIHRMVLALEERGYISRLKNRSRAIFVEGVTFVIPNDLLVSLRKIATNSSMTVADLIESTLRQSFNVPPFLSRSISRETLAAGANNADRAPAATPASGDDARRA